MFDGCPIALYYYYYHHHHQHYYYLTLENQPVSPFTLVYLISRHFYTVLVTWDPGSLQFLSNWRLTCLQSHTLRTLTQYLTFVKNITIQCVTLVFPLTDSTPKTYSPSVSYYLVRKPSCRYIYNFVSDTTSLTVTESSLLEIRGSQSLEDVRTSTGSFPLPLPTRLHYPTRSFHLQNPSLVTGLS